MDRAALSAGLESRLSDVCLLSTAFRVRQAASTTKITVDAFIFISLQREGEVYEISCWLLHDSLWVA